MEPLSESISFVNKYLPAEILYLLSDAKPDEKHLLKVTLIDLILKRVLKNDEFQYAHGPYNIDHVYAYISAGKAFDEYTTTPFEKIFTDVIASDKEAQHWSKLYVKACYKNAANEKSIISMVRHLLSEKHSETLYAVNRKNVFFKLYHLNQSGQMLASKLSEEIAKINKVIHYLAKTDQRAALKIIKMLNGNVLFLPSFTYQMLRISDQVLLTDMERHSIERSFIN